MEEGRREQRGADRRAAARAVLRAVGHRHAQERNGADREGERDAGRSWRNPAKPRKIFDKWLGAGTKFNLHRTFKIEPIKG